MLIFWVRICHHNYTLLNAIAQLPLPDMTLDLFPLMNPKFLYLLLSSVASNDDILARGYLSLTSHITMRQGKGCE